MTSPVQSARYIEVAWVIPEVCHFNSLWSNLALSDFCVVCFEHSHIAVTCSLQQARIPRYYIRGLHFGSISL